MSAMSRIRIRRVAKIGGLRLTPALLVEYTQTDWSREITAGHFFHARSYRRVDDFKLITDNLRSPIRTPPSDRMFPFAPLWRGGVTDDLRTLLPPAASPRFAHRRGETHARSR